MSRRELLGMSADELEGFFESMGQPGFRAQQVWQWIYRRRCSSFEEMTNLPLDLRRRLDEEAVVCSMDLAESSAGDDGSRKFAWRLADAEIVESVIMRYRHGTSLCVSTQVGCSIGCSFCASGTDGMVRNLDVSEIVGQWFLAQRELDGEDERISHIAVMGMGEPLHNYSRTMGALRILHSEDAAGISYRRMTLSTVGIVPGIRRLAGEDMPITLAVSLHAPNDYLRSRLVPASERYPLEKLISICKYYTETTGRRVSFEYAMIESVNDHPELARELAILLKDMMCHVNLIPVNPVPNGQYRPSSPEAVREFLEVLTVMGVGVTVRRSLGQGIDAACGQLRRRVVDSGC